MPREIDLLRALYADSLLAGSSTIGGLSEKFAEPASEIEKTIVDAAERNLVAREGRDIHLTGKGRESLQVVMIGGAFEIIHPGHIHTMEEAKKLGNTLVVVVATDKSVTKNKGREPVTVQEWRVRLVAALRIVDAAIPGGQGSIYDTLERVRPDVVALGYDQNHNPVEIEDQARRRGIKLKVVRLTSPMPDIKTSRIVSTL